MSEDKITVVVIDDEPVILYAASEILSQAGFQVKVFESPRLAINAIKEMPKDEAITLVLDLELPEMSGPNIHKEVSAIRPNIPTIFISGYHTPPKGEGLDAKSVRFLRKPFDFHVLIDEIRKIQTEGKLCP